MEVQELKKLIKENNIPNFLIFTGEEYQVQKLYIEQIAKVKDLIVSRIDSITDILGTLNSRTLISKNKVYIVRDDKAITHDDKLFSNITNIIKSNILILILTDVDKRTKFYKMYNKSYVEFNALKSEILKQYIQREIDLSDKNCEILMEICDYNYGHCLLEIDKIYSYYKSASFTPLDECFEKLLEDGTLYVPPRDTIWDFIKAFLQNKPKLAYELYQELKELETPAFAILSNLYNNTRQVLQVQTCTSDNITKTTGLTSWQIRNAKECVNRFETRDLMYLLRLIQKVESNIKQGKIDEDIAIDYVFTNFM